MLLVACSGSTPGDNVPDPNFTAQEISDASDSVEGLSITVGMAQITTIITDAIETTQTGASSRQDSITWTEVEQELEALFGDTIDIQPTGLKSVKITLSNAPLLLGLAPTTGVIDVTVSTNASLELVLTFETTDLTFGPFTVTGTIVCTTSDASAGLVLDIATTRQTSAGTTRSVRVTFSGTLSEAGYMIGGLTVNVNGTDGPSLTLANIMFDGEHLYPLTGTFAFAGTNKAITVTFVTTDGATTATMTSTGAEPRTINIPDLTTLPG